MDRKLLGLIENYPKFAEIGRHISREAVLGYLRGEKRDQLSKKVADLIEGDLERPTIVSRGIYLHELVELEHYRLTGVLGEILQGRSNKPHYAEAHKEATAAEFAFYQSMGEAMISKRIPITAIGYSFYSQPFFSRHDFGRIIPPEQRAIPQEEFTLQDIIDAISLLKLGGCDVSQSYRAIRLAQIELRGEERKENLRLKTLTSRPKGNLLLRTFYPPIPLQHEPSIKPYDFIMAYGITYADIEPDIFSGWIEVQRNLEGEKIRYIIPWIAVSRRFNCRRTFFSSRIEHYLVDCKGALTLFLDYAIDAYCQRVLGLPTSRSAFIRNPHHTLIDSPESGDDPNELL